MLGKGPEPLWTSFLQVELAANGREQSRGDESIGDEVGPIVSAPFLRPLFPG